MKHNIALALLALAVVTVGCQNRVIEEPTTTAPDVSDDDTIVCEDDFDCPERSTCGGGICREAGAGCASKAECTLGDVCVDGTCTSPPGSCTSSDHCPGVQLCDGFSRECFDPNATGCAASSDCALEPGCGGGCTCESDGLCAPVTSTNPGDDGEPTDPPPSGGAIQLGGFMLENREHQPPVQVGVLPDGLSLQPGQRLVIARDAARSAFESHWGVTLGPDVVYINAEAGNSGVPIINGNERWALVSPLGTAVDGTTIAGGQNASYRRVSASDASLPSSWSEGEATQAVPGDSALPSSGVGLVISQWSDAEGTGAYVYEFVELYYAP